MQFQYTALTFTVSSGSMSDESDEESSSLFGTPLDPYDEDEVPKKKSAFQDITEQFAYDAQGRRRFHGAFTGGFSAGYFNTVAVPEGWAPQTFKSSRSDRMQLTQKPEDFMDDEDRSEFGIAPREVQTTKEFSGVKKTKRKAFHEGPIPGEPVLQRLLEPVHETAAIRILKSMGWRPGYGVGERVTAREKKTAKKLYTCHIPAEFRNTIEQNDDDAMEVQEGDNDYEEDMEDEQDDDEYSNILFEPDDFEPFVARPKTNSFGLGYSGLSRHSILNASQKDTKSEEWTGSHLITNDKGRKVSIRGQAFGVGALEEDDDDIYAREDLSNYDFALDNLKKKMAAPAKAATKSNILEGFTQAKEEYKPTKVYLPPALPKDYVPNVSKVRKSRFSDPISVLENNTPDITMRDRTLGRHELTSNQRGIILGEKDHAEVRPQASSEETPKSTLAKDINKTYEERIAAITGRNINFTSTAKATESETPSEETVKSVDTPIEVVDSDKTFKPFSSNPAKQLRYEKFKIAKRDKVEYEHEAALGTSKKLSEWEKTRELSEFEHAYKLYKPLTGSIGDRFTTAEHSDSTALEILSKTTSSVYVTKEKQEAARLGLFGSKTREVCDWRPDSILCRRFNIPEPYSGGYAAQMAEVKKPSYSIFEYLEAPVHNKSSFLQEQNKLKSFDSSTKQHTVTNAVVSKPPISTPLPVENVENIALPKPLQSEKTEIVVEIKAVDYKTSDKVNAEISQKPKFTKRLTVAELFLQEKEKERSERASTSDEKLQFQREIKAPSRREDIDVKETIDSFNKIDLYKAIFLSDSDSEDNEESKETPVPDETAAAKNVERNPSPARGIFANLNLEKINSWREKYIQTPATSLNDTDKPKMDMAKPKTDTVKSSERIEPKNSTVSKSDKLEPTKEMEDVDTYGPRLPDDFKSSKPIAMANENGDSSSSDSDSSDWVESDQITEEKHKTKSKKLKKSSKSKKKKSKHHRHHKTKRKNKKKSH